MNKQKLTLFILLILLVCALVWSVISFPRQKKVATLANVPGQKARVIRPAVVKKAPGTPPAATTDARILQLELLNQGGSSFKGYHRNIFKPVFVDEVALMKQKLAAPKPVITPPRPVAAIKPAPLQPQIAQPEAPRSALARFTFLGFLKKDNKQTIFLTKDKEIVLVKHGDRFGNGKYEASSLTDQALTILVVDTGEEIVVPLLENKPLVAAAH